MLDFEILCGANAVWWKNILYLWGRSSNVSINFMLSVLLSNGYNIPFISILKLSPTNGQMWLWHCVWPIGPKSLCGWRYLIFYVQYLIYTRIFDFTRCCFIWTFARLNACIVPSAEWEGWIWGEMGEFCPSHLSSTSSG